VHLLEVYQRDIGKKSRIKRLCDNIAGSCERVRELLREALLRMGLDPPFHENFSSPGGKEGERGKHIIILSRSTLFNDHYGKFSRGRIGR